MSNGAHQWKDAIDTGHVAQGQGQYLRDDTCLVAANVIPTWRKSVYLIQKQDHLRMRPTFISLRLGRAGE